MFRGIGNHTGLVHEGLSSVGHRRVDEHTGTQGDAAHLPLLPRADFSARGSGPVNNFVSCQP